MGIPDKQIGTAQLLADTLYQRERAYRDAFETVRDNIADEHPALYGQVRQLREAIALVGVLRRMVQLVDKEQLYWAFGAPGDFGYDTEIGQTLASVYEAQWKSQG